jgi:hypothetical protein
MNPLLVGGIFDLAGKVFDKLFPNPEEKAKAQLELFKLQQEGAFKELEAQLQMSKGQMEINKAEGLWSGIVLPVPAASYPDVHFNGR